jgi:hypothetical protein
MLAWTISCACLAPTPGYLGPWAEASGGVTASDTGAEVDTTATSSRTNSGASDGPLSAGPGSDGGSTTSPTMATTTAGETTGEPTETSQTSTGQQSGTYVSFYAVAKNSENDLRTGNSHRMGEIVNAGASVIGRSIDRIQVSLHLEGSPTGPINVVVRSGFSDAIVQEFGTVMAEDLQPGPDHSLTFDAVTSYALAVNDKVLVEWEGTGNTNDHVHVGRYSYANEDESHEGTAMHQVHKYPEDADYNNRLVSDLAGQWWTLQ